MSPSLAAAIVVGYSINGRNAWRNKKVCLKRGRREIKRVTFVEN